MKYELDASNNPSLPLRIHYLSEKEKDKLLASALTRYFDENIPPDRCFLGGPVRFFGGEEFFRWLFAPARGYLAQHPKPTPAEIKSGRRRDPIKPSAAMVIARHFFQSKLIRIDMGRMDLIYYFNYGVSKQEFGFPNWMHP